MSGKKSSENTLYLIQASYAAAPLALSKLQQLYTSGNQVVLMGESVMHAAHEAIQALEKQISQYKKKVHAEKQFNRKVELNKQLKNLRCELEELLA